MIIARSRFKSVQIPQYLPVAELPLSSQMPAGSSSADWEGSSAVSFAVDGSRQTRLIDGIGEGTVAGHERLTHVFRPYGPRRFRL